ncbi:DHA2 family efflux MFS transporter permease subunit [Amnibacterium flavum]|uniref:DHA2 family efflux MFS transporter permease subunit n=1 Tax=Amnibacterium flavum TaxID=2173173 RepID=UPI001F0C9B9A|nr:DHA2 family efflux MFS transporter permease subunit [Amnibacterium flavum]
MNSRQRSILIVAILASFVPFLDGSIVNVALPAIVDELGGGVVTSQWVLDGYLLTLASLILLAGSISDSFGRVRVLAAGLVIFGIASVACAIAPSAGLLIAARVVQGIGGALLVPSSLAIITSNFDGALRSRAIGLWTGWTGVAFIAGPVFGGALVDLVGWRWIFGANVVPILVTILLLRRVSDPAGSHSGVRIDILGAVLGSVGLAGPVFALIESERLGWLSPAVLVPLVVGLASFVAYLLWERRAPHPMLPLSLFSVRNFAVGNLATAFIYAALSLAPLVVTLYLQQVVGAPAILAGLASLPGALIPLFLSGTFGSLAGRYGPRWFMAIGPAVAAVGVTSMFLVGSDFSFWWQLLPGLVVFGLGITITVAPLTSAVLSAVDSSRSGIASAVNNAVSRVAGLIAIAFLGSILAGPLDLDGFRRVLVVAATLLVLGAVTSAIGISNRAAKIDPAAESAADGARPSDGTAPSQA